jgi:hypothetical protein
MDWDAYILQIRNRAIAWLVFSAAHVAAHVVGGVEIDPEVRRFWKWRMN